MLPCSKIGEFVGFARRKGQVWYIAMINGDEGTKNTEITLDMLKNNTLYQSIMLSDVPNSNDDWKEIIQEVKINDKIKVEMRPRGGAVIRISPKPLNNNQ